MATWHQQQRRKRSPAPLYHPTLWTVLIDPPGNAACSHLFHTQKAAEAFLVALAQVDRARFAYILKPANAQPEA
jgi:hypothetical protein